GNALAQKVADLLGGQAVITTASDVLGHTALDLWCRDMGLTVTDKQGLTRVMTKLVNTGSVTLCSEYRLPPLPPDIILSRTPDAADLRVSCRTDQDGGAVLLYPKVLVAGIGCNRNTPAEEISDALDHACRAHELARESIRNLASIDLKRDEPGLLAFAHAHNLSLEFYSPDQLNQVEGVAGSAVVQRATGAKAVAEPAAILSSGGGRLLVQKVKFPNVTVAIAEILQSYAEPWKSAEQVPIL
ncbi:MAG: cobalamin biosynthesis protein CbiG, partial [Candidatus Electrothrix sp. AR1]|nr:cobalamin biosynthesis protein CbiG [Candidatus Electrothrix sp. AR1]